MHISRNLMLFKKITKTIAGESIVSRKEIFFIFLILIFKWLHNKCVFIESKEALKTYLRNIWGFVFIQKKRRCKIF